MKNREERPTNLDRGSTQQTFDFRNEDEGELLVDFLRLEVTDPAFADTRSLSVSPGGIKVSGTFVLQSGHLFLFASMPDER
jgi:hypothetical protein